VRIVGAKRMFEKAKEYYSENKTRITTAAVMVLGMIASVSAVDFSAITDLVDEIVLIMPSMIAMVVAAIPIIVVIALAAFIIGFLDSIVKKIG
jgi:hypothetical protein